jgi:hypothetical protein
LLARRPEEKRKKKKKQQKALRSNGKGIYLKNDTKLIGAMMNDGGSSRAGFTI